MIVLGYSGLDTSVAFASELPDLRLGEERMVQGLDSAAALLVDGKLVAAAAEERFCSDKHTNRFPARAIAYCLETAGITVADIHLIAHGFNYRTGAAFYKKFDPKLYEKVLQPELQIHLCEEILGIENAQDKFVSIDHHIAHAASAYFPSGFDDALGIVCDGMGELDSLSVFRISNGTFERLDHISIPNSIGILYSLITRHLGFKFNADEYKLMGLAPYGDPATFRSRFQDLVQLKDNGKYEIRYDKLTGSKKRDPYYRDVLSCFAELVDTPGDVDEMTQVHYDFAAAAQECLERALLHNVSHWQATTGLNRLCMAGGVSLNCTFNGKLLERNLFSEFYIQPAAGDDGTALGAALQAAHGRGEDISHCRRQEMPFYGPESSRAEIDTAIESFSDRVEIEEFASVEEAASDAAAGVAADLVQAWFQGRMEYGPRALGNRTILANPASPDIKSRVNMIVKLREGFRPFAPAVTVEHAQDYFEMDPTASPFEYMLATCQVKSDWQQKLPGITHVDGSARVQTVDRKKNPVFHRLIEEIGKATGIYCTMNTSFNVRSQPMIATAAVAVETFLRVEIDRLYLGNIRLTKR